jgi:putative Mg2+ transporter-C (MgtC) family protein
MSLLSFESLSRYWSIPEVSTNLIVFINLLGAIQLGLLVGYERSYHGRAAGMRTYGLVCMASAALTVIVGYPSYWFGGEGGTMLTAVDPKLPGKRQTQRNPNCSKSEHRTICLWLRR